MLENQSCMKRICGVSYDFAKERRSGMLEIRDERRGTVVCGTQSLKSTLLYLA